MSALDEIVKDLIGEYDAGNLEDASLAPVIKKIREGKATYGDVERLASRTGTRAGRLIAEQLAALSVDGRVTEEQARAVLMGLTRHNYDVVSGASADVQEGLNRRAGLGLKAVRPEFNRDRVEGLITEVVGKEDVPAFGKALTQQVENVSVATVDDSVKVNAKAHYNAGLSPKIVRVTDGKCCKWCDSLAGVHEYSQVNNTGNDVFRRHANCGCQILYDPGDGKKWQDVHTKRLLSREDAKAIERRRLIRLSDIRKTPKERIAEAESIIKQREFNERGRKLHFGEKQKFVHEYKTVEARKITNYSENNLYMSKDVALSPRKVRHLNGQVSAAKQLVGLDDECKVPVVIVHDDSILASYNPKENIFFISEKMANEADILKLQTDFACPDDPRSTMVHELFHWKDAEEYRSSGLEIKTAGSASEYSIFQREHARKALMENGIDLNNPAKIRTDISAYAEERWLDNDYEEVYTEFRTKQAIGR